MYGIRYFETLLKAHMMPIRVCSVLVPVTEYLVVKAIVILIVA
jgi:hypothetical protein